MKGLYNEVSSILSKIDFDAIWSGFSKYEFALYDEKNVYFEDTMHGGGYSFYRQYCN